MPPFSVPFLPSLFAPPLRRAALALFLGWPLAAANAATFTWDNTTGLWSDAARWYGTAPTGIDGTDVLVFGGDVGTFVGVVPNYTATEDLATTPVLLRELILNATDDFATGLAQTLDSIGAGLRFTASGGIGPAITQNGIGNFTLNLPLELTDTLTLGGTGFGVVTMNHAITGVADIVKDGPGTFRFGTPFDGTPSGNTWVGKLTINDGIIRFNNNADAGRTALRANAVTLTSAGAQLNATAELRTGTLSGNAGAVETINDAGGNSSNIVVHALSDGDFAGVLWIHPDQNDEDDNGILTVRGTARQTLSGTVAVNSDVSVGRGATLVLAGTASLGGNSQGAVVLNGGTFKVDNFSGPDIGFRLRDGGADSTGLDTIGGGTFSYLGSASGNIETLGRLQLGSVNNSLTTSTPRSGALTVNVTQNSGSAVTVLDFQAYTRDARGAINQTTTVNFTATNGAGQALTLGATGASGRVTFGSFTVPLLNGLLNNSSASTIPAGKSDVGWATVTTADGLDFATYSTAFDSGSGQGVMALGSTSVLPGGTGDPTVNAKLTGNGAISSGTAYGLSSLRIVPAAAGQTLSLTGAGSLDSTAFILSNHPTLGAFDYTIQNSGGGTGGIAGSGPRYFHVQQAVLTVDVSLAAADQPVVKAGDGALVLTGANTAVTQPVVINAGTLRATPGLSLPAGELRLRGGVLEITGGGVFNRQLGGSSTTSVVDRVNWSGITVGNASIAQDRGSGGFAAVDADASIDLNIFGFADLFSWEQKGFVNSGHALTFGSTRATHRITWTDDIGLAAVDPNDPKVNYNAREIRVIDNPALSADVARISGVVSGTVQNDLLKTGDGTLELTGMNTYLGNTLLYGGVVSISAGDQLGEAAGGGTVVFHDGTLRATAAGVALSTARTVALEAGGGTVDVTAAADLTLAGAVRGTSLTKTGDGLLTLTGAQDYTTLAALDGTTQINGSFTGGTATVQAFAGINFGASQTLAALNIGAGAVVTLGGAPAFAPMAVVPEPAGSLLAALGATFLGARRQRAARKSQSPA